MSEADADRERTERGIDPEAGAPTTDGSPVSDRDETAARSDTETGGSLLDGFGRPPRSERRGPQPAPEHAGGPQRTGGAMRLTRGQLIAMGVGVV
ncbi:hypothetical protein, partial [uncultured Microbacterium sp.]